MTELNMICTGGAHRLTSSTVAKCCNSTMATFRVTNGNGVVNEFTGDVVMEAG